MGSPTVNLHLESIPIVDLRLFSQSELCALAQCSTNAFNPLRCDDVVIPKIDRSVFNESVGSRKQTYSRLRLAPRNPEISTSQSRSRTSLSLKLDPDKAENRRIIGLLKDLFASESRVNDLTPIHVESLVPNLADYSEITNETMNVGQKRKRGRPRKSENYVVENDSVETVKVKNEELNVEVMIRRS
ncbi:hypothetical protein RJ641_031658 [Dillenia turbinata]|uniref:Uncharacterized protein n=1 Tax=Dillenia turbinata TaxID=194707 RepID=A0AAN8VQ43_9MAGN